jgi:hypothetical protein
MFQCVLVSAGASHNGVMLASLVTFGELTQY